jgi:hypothetical protein
VKLLYKIPDRIKDRVITPVVYRCSLCKGRFYNLRAFVDHLTLKHGIPPEEAWRFVEGREIR